MTARQLSCEGSRTVHVVHIHTNTEWGGGECQVFNLVRMLPAHGIAVTLFARREGALLERATAAGMQPVPISHGLFVRQAMVRSIAPLGADILHAHDSGGAGIAVAVGKRLGLPVVLSRRIASPIRANFVSRRKYSAGNLAAVIAISETVRRVFLETGYPPERVFTVQSGVDVTGLTALPENDAFRRPYGKAAVAVGIGRLSRKKNWGLLIRTAARLTRDGRDIHWLLIGDGPERTNLQNMAVKAGIMDRIHFLGFRPDAVSILRNSDLLFFPSTMEGASITIREAMVLGIPVVVADAPGSIESLAGNGWVVGRSDVGSAATSVLEILDNHSKRAAVCRAGREYAVRHYSLDQTVSGNAEVYRRVLTGGVGHQCLK